MRVPPRRFAAKRRADPTYDVTLADFEPDQAALKASSSTVDNVDGLTEVGC